MKFKGLYFVVLAEAFADAYGFVCDLSNDGRSWLELFRFVLFD